MFSKCSGEDSSQLGYSRVALGMVKVCDLLNEYIQKGCTGSWEDAVSDTEVGNKQLQEAGDRIQGEFGT